MEKIIALYEREAAIDAEFAEATCENYLTLIDDMYAKYLTISDAGLNTEDAWRSFGENLDETAVLLGEMGPPEAVADLHGDLILAYLEGIQAAATVSVAYSEEYGSSQSGRDRRSASGTRRC